MTLLCWTRCVPPPPANRCARKPRNGGPVRTAGRTRAGEEQHRRFDQLVDDKNAISMDDVMSYAGGLRPSFGAAADTTSKNVAKVGGVDGSSKNSGGDSSDGSADSSASSLPITGYGLAKTGFTPDNGDLIDETVELAAAAEVFDDALQAGLGGNGSGNSSAGPQYLLSVPVL